MAYQEDFINLIWPMAVEIGDKYGIDPVVITTQAVLETGWGREVAGNNYFGVKSHGRPGGINVTTHEEIGGKRVKVVDSFRQYGSLRESMEDYADFLRTQPRYADALKQKGYERQLQGLADAGYATDSKYAELLHETARSVVRRIPPTPPGEIPNYVATELSIEAPKKVTGMPAGSPMEAAKARLAYDLNRMANPVALPTSREEMPAGRKARDMLAATPMITMPTSRDQMPDSRKTSAMPTSRDQMPASRKANDALDATRKPTMPTDRSEMIAARADRALALTTRVKLPPIGPTGGPSLSGVEAKPGLDLTRVAETLPNGSNPKAVGFSFAGTERGIPSGRARREIAAKEAITPQLPEVAMATESRKAVGAASKADPEIKAGTTPLGDVMTQLDVLFGGGSGDSMLGGLQSIARELDGGSRASQQQPWGGHVAKGSGEKLYARDTKVYNNDTGRFESRTLYEKKR